MFLTFLDKLGGFFDRRFVIAFWAPSLIFSALIVAAAALIYDAAAALRLWDAQTATAQVLLSVSFLFCVSILAYLLQPFNVLLVRLYLGYDWPAWASFFEKWGRERQRGDWTEKRVPPARLRPTRLGNTLEDIYRYAYNVYRADTSIWWPRLTPLLPESFRAQVDDALMPILSLLNLSALLTLLAFGGGLALVLLDRRWWLFLLFWAGGLLLARVCYAAAVNQARSNYGALVRAAFDLYRHEIIKQMRLPLPDTPHKEFLLWARLNKWVYYKNDLPKLPWEVEKDDADPPAAVKGELRFDNYEEAAESRDGEVKVLVWGVPLLTLKTKKGA